MAGNFGKLMLAALTVGWTAQAGTAPVEIQWWHSMTGTNNEALKPSGL